MKYLLPLLFIASTLQAQVEATPWEIHEGGDPIPIPRDFMTSQTGEPLHGDSAAYTLLNGPAAIPPISDVGWRLLSDYPNGFRCTSASPDDLCYDPPLGSILMDAFRNLDFTYFQTFLDVPAATTVTTAQIQFETVDDGARAYVFNSRYPNGIYPPDGDARLRLNNVVAELTPYIVSGEENRIVVVQFDDARVKSYLTTAQLIVIAEEAGDCAVDIVDIITSDEQCPNRADGQITIEANCRNCTDSLQYSIDGGLTFQTENTFSSVSVGTYDIVVRVGEDEDCQSRSTVNIDTGIDNIPPEITVIGATAFSINCLAELPPLEGSITAVDNCDPDPDISVMEEIFRDDEGNIIVIQRRWTAEDVSGNRNSRVVQINITPDNIPPLFVGAENLPAVVELACLSDLDEPLFSIEDNCDANPEIIIEDIALLNDDGSTAYERTWTVTDSSGNVNRLVVNYRIERDTLPPTLLNTEEAQAFSIECGEAFPITDPANFITAVDACDPNPTVLFRERQEADENNPNRSILIWTWTAQDNAGNTTSYSITNRIEADNTPPSVLGLEDLSTNVVIQCRSEALDAPNLAVQDDCDPAPQLVVSTENVQQSDGSILIFWTYRVSDAAGNMDEFVIPAYRIFDTIAPTLTINNNILSVSSDLCRPFELFLSDLDVEATDNCADSINITLDQNNFTSAGTYQVVVRATDATGNSDSAIVNLTIQSELDDFSVTAVADTFTLVNNEQLIFTKNDLLQNDFSSDGRAIEVQDLISLEPFDPVSLQEIFEDGNFYQLEVDPGFLGEVVIEYVLKAEDNAYFNPLNNHFYRLIFGDLSWQQANSAANASQLYGANGYLTTITSEFENDFIDFYLSPTDAWIGAAFDSIANRWFWATGPEMNQPFWEGGLNGNPIDNSYTNWAENEPIGGQHAYYDFFEWYSSSSDNPQVSSYIVEYGDNNNCLSRYTDIGRIVINVIPNAPNIADGSIESVFQTTNQLQLQAFPNPFQTDVQVQFQLEQTEIVNLKLYDANGRQARTWQYEALEAGQQQLTILKEALPEGMYWLHLQTPTLNDNIKLLLVR